MIPLFCSQILHACPVIESHDVDLIPAPNARRSDSRFAEKKV